MIGFSSSSSGRGRRGAAAPALVFWVPPRGAFSLPYCLFFLADVSLVCNDADTLGPAARAAATARTAATAASVSASETARVTSLRWSASSAFSDSSARAASIRRHVLGKLRFLSYSMLVGS